ncbi:MAG TPA: proton-conducting transporter membrane subunit, partial [Polyangiaceae bacterium]|nr:proton-conducting transporter membrane subunit [Polyangiaceae bacterium]
AFTVMHSQTQSMTFASFANFLKTPGTMRDVTFLLLVTAFGLKSAFFPFHTWLPRAHAAAPAHVSALMSGVIHKAGLFGLLRFTLLLGEPEPWMGWYLLCFSALSASIGVLYTTSQRDLKRLLGYSSTENVGIAGMGFGVGYLGLCWHQPLLVSLGFAGGLLHLFNHALFKCLLFYAAGAVQRAAHSVDLERLGGLARKMPRTAAAFLLGGLAIAGLPPLNGFVSEFLIYSSLLDTSIPAGIEQALLVCGAALLAFIGATSALAMTRAFGLAFLGSPRDANVHARGDAARPMLLAMGVHAVLVLCVGLFPRLGLALVAQPAQAFVRLSVPASSDALARVSLRLLPIAELGALLLAVLAGLGSLRWFLARRAPAARHVVWGCGYSNPSPRMQYTGSSFSSQFTGLFPGVLLQLRRDKRPEGYFPEPGAHASTHSADVVERRLFEALAEGEGIASRVVARISEEPRFAFGFGLLILCLLAGAVVSGGGP